MNTMFQVGDFFVRLRDKGDRPKLTVWNRAGSKIVSEFINIATPSFWEQIEQLTSAEVVEQVRALVQQSE
ncbi:MAG TPA: hypothetical protein GX008_05640 [Firmicutes bacterium]|nr:MAG: hypothetical protein AA931_07535 [Peptococcaceae bacterium 1109]HHT73178.1 hypothetical protein [Bacillota bacterium]